MATAATSITAGNTSAPPVEGCVSPTFQPASQTTMLPTASTTATIAATVIARGRSTRPERLALRADLRVALFPAQSPRPRLRRAAPRGRAALIPCQAGTVGGG